MSRATVSPTSARNAFRVLLVTALLLWPAGACSDRTSRRDSIVSEIGNGRIAPPVFAFAYETLDHPRLRELRVGEKLDDVVAGGRSELEKIAVLRGWARSQWEHQDREGQIEPYCDAIHILKGIRDGSMKGGLCSEYSAVLMQACLALGFQARLVSIESRQGAGHRVVEVWSDDFDKWVVMDPLLDLHYERGGIPLNALDLHAALVAGRMGDIAVVRGGASPAATDVKTLVEHYLHLTVILRNDYLSSFDRALDNHTLSFRDEHTDGRPHFSRFSTARPEEFCWPINQTVIEIREKNPREALLRVSLTTNTPGFGHFEARSGTSAAWRRVSKDFVWKLEKGDNRIFIRAVNVLGVAGPPATLKAFLTLPQ